MVEPTDVPASAVVAPGARAQAGIARAAAINALGNVGSRLLGLVRESVIAGTFGVSGGTAAFDAVSSVPKMVYELLIGGMLSAALVPVLSEYATEDGQAEGLARASGSAGCQRREELDRILSILLSLAGIVLIVVVVVLALGAPWVAPLLLGGFDAELLRTATMLVRLIVPAILIYGISGILQAYHYARKRFVYPSLGAPAHNLGVIVAVVLLAGRLDLASLSLGIVVAATVQLLVQLPGLRGARLSLQFDWRHPVVRRILQLYAPVVLSIVIQNVGIIIDRNLASRTVAEAITWMQKATFLIQLPLGLVSMAISLAVLPTLSQIDARVELDRFRRTFSLGLRLVLVIILPAAAGLAALGLPMIRVIMERGAFTPEDTRQTWLALCAYLPGLPFAAIDLPLIFAFYAQKDTTTPVVVGVAAVLIYLAVGPALAFLLGWGYLGLAAANSVQLTCHALMMLWAFGRRFQGLRGYGVATTAAKAALASLLAGALAYGGYAVAAGLAPGRGLATDLLGLLVGGGAAVAGYVAAARVLRIQELAMVAGIVRRRLGAR